MPPIRQPSNPLPSARLQLAASSETPVRQWTYVEKAFRPSLHGLNGPMLISATMFALASADLISGKAEWFDCLDRYAQVAMFSSSSSWEIAKDALSACTDERKAYQLALLEERSKIDSQEDGPAFARRLAEADRDAAMRVVAFLNQNRNQR